MIKNFSKKAREYSPLLLRLILAGGLFAFALINYNRLVTLDIRAMVAAAPMPFLAVLAVLGVYVLKSLVFVVPASLVYIYTGMAFDFKQALLINFFGIFLEVVITFWLGRFLGGDYVAKKISGQAWVGRLEKIQDKNKLLFLFTLRALPVFPIDFVSLFLGAWRFDFWPYLLISLVGIWPRVFLFTLLGDGIYDYIPMNFLIGVSISSIPIALAAWLFKFFKARRTAAKAEEKTAPEP